MFSEFKAFIARGNMLDLAVAVIIGAAFATTASLTDDIIMPLVGALFGGLDFANHFTLLAPIPATFHDNVQSYVDLKKAGVAVPGWGQFATMVVNFLILAFVIFMISRWANRLLKRSVDAPSGPTETQFPAEIRDELRRRP